MVPSVFREHMDVLACPRCRGDLQLVDNRVICLSCGHKFPCEDAIPLLFWPTEVTDPKSDITEVVRSFYEANPFPNYDDLDSSQRLREKAEKGIFARLLDQQILHPAMILEVGCGTGQLTNFLAPVWGRTVFGTDVCVNSLRLGEQFRKRNHVENCAFIQMNLFRPVFKPEGFSLVICNGVLHHTADPFGGFQSISKLVRKGGHIIIGLYNTWGRLFTDLRRLTFRLSGNRFQWLDPHLRNRNVGQLKKHAWFMDQYKHPHESKHTMGEVLAWFDRTGFEYVNSIPKTVPFAPISSDEQLFEVHKRGNKLEVFMAQMGMVLRGGREGGFFVMIGRRKSEAKLGQSSPSDDSL